MRWAAWCNAAVGVLLAIAPFALGYYTTSGIAMYEALAVGVLIGAIALWAAVGRTAPAYLDYILMVLGGWSIVAPFILGYSAIQQARNVDIVAGVVVVAVALFSRFYAAPVARRKAAA